MSKAIMSAIFVVLVLVAGVVTNAEFRNKVNLVVPTQVATTVETAVPAQAVSGSTLSKILEKGYILASVQNPSKPFYSADNGGRAKGFNVDFMNILVEQGAFKGKVNVTKSADVSTYADVPKQLLSSKKVDIAIDGLTFNDEDLPGVVYTIPYVKDFGYSLITVTGNNVQSVADTAGMNIGVLQGDPDAKAFVEGAFPSAKIVELSDKADASGKWIVGHIKSKKVDAVVYDYPFAVAEVAGTDLQFAITKIKGSDIQYRIGVRKEDKDLLTALNSAIRLAMDTPEYPEMLKKYFMSDKVSAVRRAGGGEVGYVVLKGDTLSTIAQTQLGDKMKFGEIQTRNNLANPNFIAVGQKLVIPAK